MDTPRSRKSPFEPSRYTTYQHWRIYQIGRFIACAMECLPNSVRGLIIREIQRIQNGQHYKFSLQLMRLENYRLNQELYDQPENQLYYKPQNYTHAILAYIASLPFADREPVLNDILDAIEETTNEEIMI